MQTVVAPGISLNQRTRGWLTSLLQKLGLLLMTLDKKAFLSLPIEELDVGASFKHYWWSGSQSLGHWKSLKSFPLSFSSKPGLLSDMNINSLDKDVAKPIMKVVQQVFSPCNSILNHRQPQKTCFQRFLATLLSRTKRLCKLWLQASGLPSYKDELASPIIHESKQ